MSSSTHRSPSRGEHRQVRRQTAGSSGFYISDSSPFIRFDEGRTPSWKAGYASQAGGYDRTLKVSTKSDATISLNVTASSLTFLIPSFDSCRATISVNGSTPVTACATPATNGDIPFILDALPAGLHSVTWSAGPMPVQEQIVFWGIEGTRPPEQGGMTNVTIDNTYQREGPLSFNYQGAWDHLAEGGGSTLTEASTLASDFNRSLAVTTKQGAAVTFKGRGSAVYLYGTVGPEYGTASLRLNGNVVAPLMNLTSPWSVPYELLWFTTGLGPASDLEMTMTNLEEKKMAVDFVILTTDADTVAALNLTSTSAPFASTLAGKLVLGLALPVAVLVALAALIYFCCMRRRDRRRGSTDGQISLQPGTSDGEKRSSTAWSQHSDTAPSEIFVSYDEARGQRLSERWVSPASPESIASGSQRGGHSPLATVAEDGRSDTETTAGTWSRPLHGLLGSDYAESTIESDDYPRRQTRLPPYTPGSGSHLTGSNFGMDGHSPLEALPNEKANHLRYLDSDASEQSHGSHRPPSTIASSEIMSVYGQPPSERRASWNTAYSPLQPLFTQPLPSIPTHLRPFVNTTLPEEGQLEDSPHDRTAPSSLPTSTTSPTSERAWEGANPGLLGRYRSMKAFSTKSAARPDSEVIPFETFMSNKP